MLINVFILSMHRFYANTSWFILIYKNKTGWEKKHAKMLTAVSIGWLIWMTIFFFVLLYFSQGKNKTKQNNVVKEWEVMLKVYVW